MFYSIRNAKAHVAPGKVPFFKFDFGLFATTDIKSLQVTLLGVRHQGGRFLPAQARLANGSFWNHWKIEPIVENQMMKLVASEPAWADYQNALKMIGQADGLDTDWAEPTGEEG